MALESITSNAVVKLESLQGIDLRGADFSRVNLCAVDLQGANLEGAILIGTNLTGADLRGANLTRANLRGANLAGADLANACLERAKMRCMNLHRADLRDANLKSASLQGSDLTEANLDRANLDFANLYCTRLNRALLPIGVAYITNGGLWDVTIVNNYMRIGCEYHTIEVWDAFSDEEIDVMEKDALAWWRDNKEQVMTVARATQAQSIEVA